MVTARAQFFSCHRPSPTTIGYRDEQGPETQRFPHTGKQRFEKGIARHRGNKPSAQMPHDQQHQTNHHVDRSTNPGKDCDDGYANWTQVFDLQRTGNVANPRYAVKPQERSREKVSEKGS
jgi:hypothetical protein